MAPNAGDGNITIVVSGTTNEPRAALTPMALDLLRGAAEAQVGPHDAGFSATIVSADGTTRFTNPLTPRRANGAVEHGLQRDSLEDANLQKVAADVGAVQATRSGLDLVDVFDRATAGPPGSLIVVSNGLSTDGALDLREVRWGLEPPDVVGQLRQKGALPDLRGWHVLWIGLNATAGAQEPLPKPARDKNLQYWTAVCEAAGALSCAFDETELPPDPPRGVVATPAVAVPKVRSMTGPTELVVDVPEALLGFGPDSAELSATAAETIAALADDVADFVDDHPAATVTVTGYTADPPGSTVEGREALSLARAQAVAAALRATGITNEISAAGGGAAPNATCLRDGSCIEALAEPMRRVEVITRSEN